MADSRTITINLDNLEELFKEHFQETAGTMMMYRARYRDDREAAGLQNAQRFYSGEDLGYQLAMQDILESAVETDRHGEAASELEHLIREQDEKI